MKRILKWLGAVLGVLLVVVAVFAGYVATSPLPRYPVQKVAFTTEVTPERVARGKRHVELLCAACHFDSATGGLTGKRMVDLPAQFGVAYSKNITGDRERGIGAWTDAEIAYLLRTGLDREGRYTPPWMVKLPNASEEDIRDIVAFLRSGDPLVRPQPADDRASEPSFLTRLLSRVAFGPFAYPDREIVAPPPTDQVAFGRYLVTSRLQCFACHSKDFTTNDDLRPEQSAGYLGGGNAMPDLAGRIVHTSNLTPDRETGLGQWTEAQFRRALVEGIRPDNRPLRYPMVPFRILDDQEVSAIFAYLRTVPALRNTIPVPETVVIGGTDRGRQIFYKYGCDGCHGDTGLGQFDLRRGSARHPTDDALIAYIKHPERTRPGIAMPTWDGVIAEDEYGPLAAFVRTLSAEGR